MSKKKNFKLPSLNFKKKPSILKRAKALFSNIISAIVSFTTNVLPYLVVIAAAAYAGYTTYITAPYVAIVMASGVIILLYGRTMIRGLKF